MMRRVTLAPLLVLLVVGGLLYGTAILLVALRWRRNRPMCCRRCAHPIAEGQGERCVECGNDLTPARNRWFEPGWVRNVQLAVGALGLAAIAFGVHARLNRQRQVLTFESRVRLHFEDGGTSELAATIVQRCEADGSNLSQAELASYALHVRQQEVLRFRISRHGSSLRLESGDQTVPASDAAITALLVERGGVRPGSEAAYFTRAALAQAEPLSLGVQLVQQPKLDGLSDAVLAADSDAGAVGAGATWMPGMVMERETKLATMGAGVVSVLGVALLLVAAFLRRPIDGPAARDGESSTSSG